MPGAREIERSTAEVKVSAERMRSSAEAMKASTGEMKDSADRRTELAADRTVLAAERTYASWVQLGLGSLAAGIGAKKLLEGVVPEWMIILQGTLLVLFSVFCFGAAVWRQMTPGVPPPRPDVRRIPAYALITVNAFLALLALSALAAIRACSRIRARNFLAASDFPCRSLTIPPGQARSQGKGAALVPCQESPNEEGSLDRLGRGPDCVPRDGAAIRDRPEFRRSSRLSRRHDSLARDNVAAAQDEAIEEDAAHAARRHRRDPHDRLTVRAQPTEPPRRTSSGGFFSAARPSRNRASRAGIGPRRHAKSRRRGWRQGAFSGPTRKSRL
jgi:putative membrane protein